MSETTPNDTDVDASGTAAVKKPQGHGSHRITPPLAVREAVGMTADEPWSWYYHDDTDVIWLRRAGGSLAGIPDDSEQVGMAEARQNGRYIDFAIPPFAVETAGLEKGDRFDFRVIGPHTIRMTAQRDE